jgi:hypothetical protein
VAPRDDAQRAVLGGLPIDGETGGDGALRGNRTILDSAFAKARVLVKAVRGVFGSRRLPMHLMGDLLDVRTEEGLEHLEE